jgi:hypothetical protein
MSITDLIEELRRQSKLRNATWPCVLLSDLLPLLDSYEALSAEVERLKVGNDRYETVRRMSVQQFRDAYALNIRASKSFDKIIDELKPFREPPA